MPAQKKRNAFRQGDILFIETDAVPATAKPKNSLVIAEGEVSGHNHQFVDATAVKVFTTANDWQQYAEVTKPAVLHHEEHQSYEIPVGTYEVLHQREATLEDTERNVLD